MTFLGRQNDKRFNELTKIVIKVPHLAKGGVIKVFYILLLCYICELELPLTEKNNKKQKKQKINKKNHVIKMPCADAHCDFDVKLAI